MQGTRALRQASAGVTRPARSHTTRRSASPHPPRRRRTRSSSPVMSRACTWKTPLCLTTEVQRPPRSRGFQRRLRLVGRRRLAGDPFHFAMCASRRRPEGDPAPAPHEDVFRSNPRRGEAVIELIWGLRQSMSRILSTRGGCPSTINSTSSPIPAPSNALATGVWFPTTCWEGSLAPSTILILFFSSGYFGS